MRYLREQQAGGLPLEVTGFVGREQELREIGALLDKARLVSLIGPGGVGKTRLALRTARTALPYFPDRACFVELSSLHDPVLLPHTVAAALGLSEQGDRDPVGLLVSYLAAKRLLLVLDTCEHMLDACAMLADLMLRMAPGVTVLVTSRQPLDVPGEFVYPITPLPTDREAVQLFAERAAAVVPGFAVTDANRKDVTSVCRRLDGMPLAIELAVVRLRVLSLGDLAARLEHRFQALTGGRRGAVPRHRTLQDAIDWSHDLCTPREQLLWRRLSVFAGEFDAEAAETVCGGGELPAEDVLEQLIGLVDKSVVLRIEAEQARYRLLDTLREYGAERLTQSGEEEAYRRAHFDYFAVFAERADRPFHSDRQAEHLRALARWLQNFRIAMEYGTSTDDPELALRGLDLATRLWTHWITTGRLREGARWLERGLANVEHDCPERVEALHRIAWALMVFGRHDESEPYILESLAMAERIGDRRGATYAKEFHGCLSMVCGRLDEAHRDLNEARRGFRELSDNDGLAITCFIQTFGAAVVGDVEHAWEISGEGLRALEPVPGECWSRSYCLLYRQLALWMAHEDSRAEERDRLGREALVLKLAVNDRLGAAVALELLAWSAGRSERFERSAWLLGAAEAIWTRIGGARLFNVPILNAERDTAVTAARTALGDSAYADHHARGAALDLTESVTYAVQDTDALPKPPPGIPTPGIPTPGIPMPGSTAASAGTMSAPSTPQTVPGTVALPAPDRTTPRPPGLTNRERQVAALVAEGLTNRQIAERLVVSKRTADAHVEHILNKLGLTSRTQITGLE
ncbi:LuxR C-terminal-related transcriptional regulator [Streptomyces ochraceiscleroticus]|uniref:LuxR C-terminal-related transcriptional regulator n=1 Tax=Streptomyces ochraceiscleroticus TaxID=47761 RepID=A0ABW1MIW9_9ACTN|nr:LuxR C-terminal-related transcriptional regulator [Streptomyces ochraceiscleroticus]